MLHIQTRNMYLTVQIWDNQKFIHQVLEFLLAEQQDKGSRHCIWKICRLKKFKYYNRCDPSPPKKV